MTTTAAWPRRSSTTPRMATSTSTPVAAGGAAAPAFHMQAVALHITNNKTASRHLSCFIYCPPSQWARSRNCRIVPVTMPSLILFSWISRLG
ncbi:MAG: hypothetical protein R6X18_08510 [Chloroflexota bacterium]